MNNITSTVGTNWYVLMKRQTLRQVLAIALLVHGTSALAARDIAVEASPVLDDRYPRAQVEFAAGAVSYPDLVYSRPPGARPLRLDLYKPTAKAPSSGYPLVVYIHGGGWQSGHTRHSGAFGNWPNVLAELSAKGYVVVSIEYRLSNEARFPAAIHDVKTSLRWLRANAREFGVDRSRAIVWGGSAGGQLAALAATTCDDEQLMPTFTRAEAALAAESDCVQGAVAWYGIFDFRTLPEFSGATTPAPDVGSAAAKYLDCKSANCPALALASAAAHVDARTAPMLLIHGDGDRVVPVAQSQQFEATLRAKKIPAELIVIAGADHSFIGATPQATRAASLQALNKTFDFIAATFGAKRP
jgi:acetyl esterase/lipase